MSRSGFILMLVGPLIMACVPVSPGAADNDPTERVTLIIFHNNTGPMCLEALDWLGGPASQYADLVVEERLVFDEADLNLLAVLKTEHGESQGVSSSYGYLPIIFIRDQAFSGFNDDVAAAIGRLLDASQSAAWGLGENQARLS